MDSLAPILVLIIVLALTGAAAVATGFESRDGFRDPSLDGRPRWNL